MLPSRSSRYILCVKLGGLSQRYCASVIQPLEADISVRLMLCHVINDVLLSLTKFS